MLLFKRRPKVFDSDDWGLEVRSGKIWIENDGPDLVCNYEMLLNRAYQLNKLNYQLNSGKSRVRINNPDLNGFKKRRSNAFL